MKIEGPNKTAGSKGVSKTGGAKGGSGSGFSGLVNETEESAPQHGASGVMSINSLDALLSLQELGNSTEEGSKKAARHAAGLLDQLDRIRMGLLNGSIPMGALEQLTRMIGQHREKVIDPKLGELLDDIDLRVQVELAKFDRDRV